MRLKGQQNSSLVVVFFQFVKFGIVGITNTVISYLANIGILLLLDGHNINYDYVIANIVAFVVGTLWAFFWNKKYVFTDVIEEISVSKALTKTFLSYAFTGILLNNALAFLWVDILHISKYISPLINLVITVPLNFALNKLWAFSKEK